MEKEIITNKVKDLLIMASKEFGMDFPEIEIKFDLKGVRAGTFCFKNPDEYQFIFNLDIFKVNRDNFDQTIIHEVSHYIIMKKYGLSVKNDPHGNQWKEIVIFLGGVPSKYHNLKLPHSLKKKITNWNFKCDCQTINIPILIRKSIEYGTVYFCKKCKGKLISEDGETI